MTEKERERAFQTLAEAGKQVEGLMAAYLKAALASKPSLEQHRRLQGLLKRLVKGRLPPEQVRPKRALEILERIGTRAAQGVLEHRYGRYIHSWNLVLLLLLRAFNWKPPTIPGVFGASRAGVTLKFREKRRSRTVE
jgi:hypothetical protein